ncbi:GTP cyclohydrolase I FolE [Candidatus Fermentibacteria bacterium]|nr:GTP cyclohydrolase I FolE [Candidatus Fermentibacteria bacterium]
MNRRKVMEGIRLILEGIGENPEREGLRETPQRVAESMAELCRGVDRSGWKKISTMRADNQNELIIVKDISFASLCEHHLLPFVGRCDVVYLPANDRIAGLSSIVETVETMAARPMIQERLTTEIADRLMKEIGAKGVMVVMEAEHMCLAMRGVKKRDSRIVTSAMRGYLKKLETRTEALSLIGRSINSR